MTPSDDIVAAAQASQAKWKIPASLTLAQWALESGWGRSTPADSNNPFGIKASGDQPYVVAQTREVVDGQSIWVNQNFRKYASIAEAFDDHGRLLATAGPYHKARDAEPDPMKMADALTGVYATDPKYGTTLKAIIQGSHLQQYDLPEPAVKPQVLAVADAAGGGSGDGAKIAGLVAIASDHAKLLQAQAVAAQKLLDYDGEKYPTDGCAITLCGLMQQAGIDVDDTYLAIELGRVLMNKRGWRKIALGDHKAGDVGSTCGDSPVHGTDHIYLVIQLVNSDEMIIADNQQTTPHFRFVSGKGRSPTRFFLRAPGA